MGDLNGALSSPGNKRPISGKMSLSVPLEAHLHSLSLTRFKHKRRMFDWIFVLFQLSTFNVLEFIHTFPSVTLSWLVSRDVGMS